MVRSQINSNLTDGNEVIIAQCRASFPVALRPGKHEGA
jgi:hypothetical protein